MSITPAAPPDATTTARGLMSASDKTKLDGLPAPATLEGRISAIETDVTALEVVAHVPVTLDGASSGWLTLAGQVLKLTLTAAGAAADGIVTQIAQTFAGVKTFAAKVIAAAGVEVTNATGSMWNTNGTGASDVCVKVGTSTADASVNANAKLWSARTGLNGGSEVESLAVYKGGTLGGGSGFLILSGTVGARLVYLGAAIGCNEFVANQTAMRSSLGAGASDVGNVIGFSTADASVNATAHIGSFGNAIGATYAEKWFFTKTNLEATTAASGIVLKSPDGTRYRITINNGGTINIAAA